MDLNQESPAVQSMEPVERSLPGTVHALRLVLRVQAGWYGLSAAVATVVYLVQGGDTPGLGAYPAVRTHPITMVVVALVVGGLLLELSRRIPRPPIGLHRFLTFGQYVLLLDGITGLLLGIFDVWWIGALLATCAALFYLRSEDTVRHLGEGGWQDPRESGARSPLPTWSESQQRVADQDAAQRGVADS
jgi:hypothetical protein